MSTNVTLPALGESVTEGTVSRWLKAVGDRVEADEPLLEVSTDKVDTEIPSPAAGVLLEIKVEEDDTCEVGGILAVIGDESEAGQGGSGDEAPSGEAEAAQSEGSVPEQGEPQGMAPDMGSEPKEDATDPTPTEDAPAKAAPAGDAPKAETKAAPKSGGSAQGTEVKLPALGESVSEGVVSRWLKAVGDTVEADEPLLEVSTDKVDTEVPSPVAGTLLEIRVQEDETCEVGGVLAIVGDASAAEADDQPEADEPEAPKPEAPEADDAAAEEADAAESPEADVASAKQTPAEKAGDEVDAKPTTVAAERSAGDQQEKEAAVARRAAAPSEGEGDDIYVTPLVRKMAAEHGVDLKTLVGTGVGGRIRKQDVLAAAEGKAAPAAESAPAEEKPATPGAAKPAATPATQAPAAKAAAPVKPSPEAAAKRGTTEKMTRLRATIAKRMVESLQVSAQLTATVEVDLTNISKLRGQVKEGFKKTEGVGLSYLPFITKVAVETLKAFPALNATIDTEAGTITYNDDENIGIAVDTPKGLLVPVIKNAGDLNIAGLAKGIQDLAARTRDSKVTPDELTGGTFTITNYGSAGALFDTPIINQPQVAILGTGAIVKRPVVISDERFGDTVVVRDMMYLSLSYDHRLIDGANAARFLSAMKARLEEGDFTAEFGL